MNVMKLNRLRTQRRNTAFTLVELVIVLTIIALLAGSGVYLMMGLTEDAQITRIETDVKTLQTTLMSYERNNYSRPPTQEQGLRALWEKPEPAPQRWRQYLEEPMLDPWGQEYQYRYPAQKSKKRYDIFSFGEDGVESEDDIGNW